MEKAELLKGLAVAKARADKSKAIAAFQRHVIAELTALGRDTATAESFLPELEKTETDDLAEFERILNALDDQARQ
jgi:hypothetical protein